MTNKIWFFFLISLFACSGDNYTPKPKAYPRIDFPPKEYKKFTSDCPFEFEYLRFARVNSAEEGDYPCWMNIDYPFLKGRVHLSYKKVENNLGTFIEDSRTLVYKHTIRASAIDEINYLDTSTHVYAKIYELSGNTASSIQFYATDSLHHFIRGALYFNARTNADSLRPAIRFIRSDLEHFVSSLRWNHPAN